MNITVEGNRLTNTWHLMVSDGKMSPMPAGQRLFRIPERANAAQLAAIPDIDFAHGTESSAEADAAKLRAYLSSVDSKKASKKELRDNA